MKIKAMVDGIEREVELTEEQTATAFAELEKHYDVLNYVNNLDCFISDMCDTDDEYKTLTDHMLAVKKEVIKAYRNDLNNDSEDWWYFLKNAVETEASDFLAKLRSLS